MPAIEFNPIYRNRIREAARVSLCCEVRIRMIDNDPPAIGWSGMRACHVILRGPRRWLAEIFPEVEAEFKAVRKEMIESAPALVEAK